MPRRRTSKRRAKRLSRGWILALAGLALAVGFLAAPKRTLGHWWSERAGIARVEGHADWILQAAREARVDPNLLAGMMMVESRGHVGAESPAGALGLMQLVPATAEERAQLLRLPKPTRRALLSDGELNTRLGAHYLAWLLKRFDGDEERALIAYNTGPTRLQRWIKEAGSYAAWRDARERAGNSDVLAYARNVLRYRKGFADRGAIVPTVLSAPSAAAGSGEPAAVTTEESPSLEPGFLGPPAPKSQQ